MQDVEDRVIDLTQADVPDGIRPVRSRGIRRGDRRRSRRWPSAAPLACVPAGVDRGCRGPLRPTTGSDRRSPASSPWRRSGERSSAGRTGTSTATGRRRSRDARCLVSPELDRSARMFMWMEAALLPADVDGARRSPGADRRPHPAHPRSPEAQRRSPGGSIRDSGLPWRIEAIRYREAGGPPIHQRIDLGGWRTFGDIRCWSSARVTWADEARAWFDWTLDEVEQGALTSTRSSSGWPRRHRDGALARTGVPLVGRQRRRDDARAAGRRPASGPVAREHSGDHDRRAARERSGRGSCRSAIGRPAGTATTGSERAVGCRYVDGQSSTRIVPELQELRVGRSRLVRAARVDPGHGARAAPPPRDRRELGVRPRPVAPVDAPVSSCAPGAAGCTSGCRAIRALRPIGDVVDHAVGEPLHFAMERKMMLGIKERAERLALGRAV